MSAWEPPTPGEVQRGLFRWFPTTVITLTLLLVLGGGVTLVCWQAAGGSPVITRHASTG